VAIDKTKLTYNAAVDVKAAASIWGDWNTQGQFTGGGSDVNGSVTANGVADDHGVTLSRYLRESIKLL
jgi:hypothetical protein